MSGKSGRETSAHLAQFRAPADLRHGLWAKHIQRLGNWTRLIEVRNAILKALETARNEKKIGSGLEAKVHLDTNTELFPLLQDYGNFLPTLFIVSQVNLSHEMATEAQENRDSRPARANCSGRGKKCLRCWNYSVHVGEDAQYPHVCERCSDALKDIVPHI